MSEPLEVLIAFTCGCVISRALYLPEIFNGWFDGWREGRRKAERWPR